METGFCPGWKTASEADLSLVPGKKNRETISEPYSNANTSWADDPMLSLSYTSSYTVKRKIQDIWSQMCWWHELAAALESELPYQIKSVPWRLAQLTSACVWLKVVKPSKKAGREARVKPKMHILSLLSVFWFLPSEWHNKNYFKQ